MAKVSVIIPVYQLEGYRLQSFQNILQKICKVDFFEIIVAEQLSPGQTSCLTLPDNVIYLPVYLSYKPFHKTHMVNCAVQRANGDFIWMNDCDLFLPFDKVIKQIKDDDIAIMPFKHFIYLDKDETQRLINREKIRVMTGSHKRIQIFGAGAFIMKRNAFLSVGGMNEAFCGWGHEDLELQHRVKSIYNIRSLSSITGLHLFHQDGSNKEKEDLENLTTFNYYKSRYNDPAEYINNVPSIFNHNKMCVIDENSDIQNIVHVVNLSNFEHSERLRKAQKLLLESIECSVDENVTHIAALTQDVPLDGWIKGFLSRDAHSVFGICNDMPFLKDLLDLACSYANDDDWLVFTNTDCCISIDFYQQIRESSSNVIGFHRLDVDNNASTYEDMCTLQSSVFNIGIDGFAIKAVTYKETKRYIPDFVIGEPHWDTCIVGLYDRLGLMERNATCLYHKYHEQKWDDSDLSRAGRHNKELFEEALESGLSDTEIITLDRQCDTAGIIVTYGNDKKRIRATKNAFRQLYKQSLPIHLFFIELIFDDDDSNYSDFLRRFQNVTHHIVVGTDSNRDLWQKEALMNIGASFAVDYKYLIFLDGDIYSKRTEWLERIRYLLSKSEYNAVQGFRLSRDTEDERLSFMSMASIHCLDYDSDLPINPGLCWGITQKFYKSMCGFNPFFIDGGGDSGFVSEFLNNDNVEYDTFLSSFNWFDSIYRQNLPKAELQCVDVDIVHVNHGPFKKRNYNTIRYCIDKLGKPINDFVRLDANNLLAWIDPNCSERKLLKLRSEMSSNDDVNVLYQKIIGE